MPDDVLHAVKEYWFLVVGMVGVAKYAIQQVVKALDERDEEIDKRQVLRHNEIAVRIKGVELRFKELNGSVAKAVTDIGVLKTDVAVLDERTKK